METSRVTPLVEPLEEPTLFDELRGIVAALDALAELPGRFGAALLSLDLQEIIEAYEPLHAPDDGKPIFPHPDIAEMEALRRYLQGA